MASVPKGRVSALRHAFAEQLRSLVASRGGELAILAKVNTEQEIIQLKTFLEFLSGTRLPGIESLNAILAAIQPTQEEQIKLRQAFEAADAMAKRPAIADVPTASTQKPSSSRIRSHPLAAIRIALSTIS